MTPNYEAQKFFAENRLESVVASSASTTNGFHHVYGWRNGALSLICVNMLDIPRDVIFKAGKSQGEYMLPPKSYKCFTVKQTSAR